MHDVEDMRREIERLRDGYEDLRHEIAQISGSAGAARKGELSRRRGVLAAAGTTAELLLKFIYRREGKDRNSKPADKLMLDELQSGLTELLPKGVQSHLRTVQSWRNVAAHDNKGDLRLDVDDTTLRIVDEALSRVVIWFFNDYLRGEFEGLLNFEPPHQIDSDRRLEEWRELFWWTMRSGAPKLLDQRALDARRKQLGLTPEQVASVRDHLARDEESFRQVLAEADEDGSWEEHELDAIEEQRILGCISEREAGSIAASLLTSRKDRPSRPAWLADALSAGPASAPTPAAAPVAPARASFEIILDRALHSRTSLAARSDFLAWIESPTLPIDPEALLRLARRLSLVGEVDLVRDCIRVARRRAEADGDARWALRADLARSRHEYLWRESNAGDDAHLAGLRRLRDRARDVPDAEVFVDACGAMLWLEQDLDRRLAYASEAASWAETLPETISGLTKRGRAKFDLAVAYRVKSSGEQTREAGSTKERIDKAQHEAREALTSAAREITDATDPEEATEAWIELARARQPGDPTEERSAALERALKVARRNSFHLSVVECLIYQARDSMHDPEAARITLLGAAEALPAQAPPLLRRTLDYSIALSAIDLGNYSEAIARLEPTVASDRLRWPTLSHWSIYHLARSHAGLGEWAKARNLVEEARALEPHKRPNDSLFVDLLHAVLEAMGEHEAAEKLETGGYQPDLETLLRPPRSAPDRTKKVELKPAAPVSVKLMRFPGSIDSLAVADLARSIAGDTADPMERIYLLFEWMHANVAHMTNLELYGEAEYVATPAETVKNKAGDAASHASLLGSLSAALGIDGRFVISGDHTCYFFRIDIAPGRVARWIEDRYRRRSEDFNLDANHFPNYQAQLAKGWAGTAQAPERPATGAFETFCIAPHSMVLPDGMGGSLVLADSATARGLGDWSGVVRSGYAKAPGLWSDAAVVTTPIDFSPSRPL